MWQDGGSGGEGHDLTPSQELAQKLHPYGIEVMTMDESPAQIEPGSVLGRTLRHRVLLRSRFRARCPGSC